MIDANQNAQIASLGDRDVSVIVPTGEIGASSFDKVPGAIPRGGARADEGLVALFVVGAGVRGLAHGRGPA